MTELKDKKCQICENGGDLLDLDSIHKLIKDIPEWQLGTDKKNIERKFKFKGFYATMSFVNAVAYLAQKEGHHPDLFVGYNYCTVRFTTHALNGLSENDFICAAKINNLL